MMDDAAWGAVVSVAVTVMLLCRTIGPFTLAHNVLLCLRANVPKLRARLPTGLIVIRDRETVKFWAPFLMIGPIPIALIGLVDIVFGQLVFYWHRAEACSALRLYLMASVVVSYVFLIVWAWAYVGDERYEVRLPYVKRRERPVRVVLCRPYADLGEVAVAYLDCGLWSVAVAALLTASIDGSCPSPSVNFYAVVLALAYWWSFVSVLYAAGGQVARLVARKALVRARQTDLAEQEVPLDADGVRDRFALIGGSRGEIPVAQFRTLVQECQLKLQDDELLATRDSLDHDGVIEFGIFWDWYSEVVKDAEPVEDDDDDDDTGVPPRRPADTKKPARPFFGALSSKKKKSAKVSAAGAPSSDDDDATDESDAASEDGDESAFTEAT